MRHHFSYLVLPLLLLSPHAGAQQAERPLVANEVKVSIAPKITKKVSRAIDEIIINAREENDELIITIDREAFTREQLAAMLQRMVAVNPNQPVHIRADAEMRWQKVADVISTCSQAGVWNVSFSKQLPAQQTTTP